MARRARDADARVAASGELAARAAHLHHQQGRTNIEIAEELGISPLGIPALLRQAEAEGTVSYLINPPAGLDADRSDRVREKYSLAEALIPTSTLLTAVASLTARYPRELLVGGAVVGVSWGELVARVVRELEARGPLPSATLSSCSEAHPACSPRCTPPSSSAGSRSLPAELRTRPRPLGPL